MKLHFAAVIVALGLSLTACQDHALVLNGASPTTLRESAQAIRASLAGDKLTQFDHAVTVGIASALDPVEILNLAQQGTMPTDASVFAKIKPYFDGLTSDQVVAKQGAAEQRVKAKLVEWEQKRSALRIRRQARQDIAALLAKVHATHIDLRTAQAELPGLGDNRVILDVTLQNDLDHPLQGGKFYVSLMPHGIDNPWVTQSFTRTFPTPIAPGGSARFELSPIEVSIPDAYKGPVTLEAAVDFQRAELVSASPLVLPSWTQRDEIEDAKLETAVTEVRDILDKPTFSLTSKE